MSLWDETIRVLGQHGFTWEDVSVVYGKYFTISKDNFEKIARKTEYDSGFGAQAIAIDLEIAGKDFRFVRKEYDGSEWRERTYQNWKFPLTTKEVKTLGDDVFLWKTLSYMNSEEGLRKLENKDEY